MTKTEKILTVVVFTLPILAFLYFQFFVQAKDSISVVLKSSGYIEIKPPSNLIPPGTWVSILSENPLTVSIICPPERALGADFDEQLLQSGSADTELVSKLSNAYSLGAALNDQIKGDSKFNSVESVSIKLTNIEIIEVANDTVLSGIRSRELNCKDAIRLQYDTGTISMIKSVLVADAQYEVSFEDSIDSTSKANLKKELALKLDLRLQASKNGTSTIVGKGLIWGVREDANLAKYGLELPSTGGQNENNEVLAEKGPANISFKSTRRAFSEEEIVVSHSVEPIRQTSAMSCWATVFTMMDSWKNGHRNSTVEVVTELGDPWIGYYLEDEGLPASEQKSFVSKVNMHSSPPANYTLEAYVKMLKEKGPLWIVTGDGLSSHARLLIGIYGNAAASGIGAYEQTTFEFIDPLTGTYSYSTGLEFVNHFEAEARWLVDNKFTDIEFRDQILYWP
jgi:hypothetical protein